MGQPIRWDNVGGANLSEASRPLEAAARSFDGAFDKLGQALASREAVTNANWQNTKANNTTAYLDAVAKLRTPEELAAAQAQGGALDQLRQQFGYQVDSNAIRGAADARMATVMDQKQKQIAYDHVLTDERVAPLADAFKVASLKGDQAGMDAAQAKYSELGGRDLAGLVAHRDARVQEITNRGMAMEDHQMKADRTTAEIANMKEMAGIASRNADTNAAQAATAAAAQRTQAQLASFQIETGTADRATAKAAGQAAALKGSLRENGNLYADGSYNGTGSQVEDLRKFMKDNNIGGGNADKQAEIINFVNDIAKKGIDVKGPDGKTITTIHDIPLAAVKSAIGGATNDFWNVGWNTGPAKNVRDALTSIVGATNKDANGQLSSKALDDLRSFTDAVQRVRDNAPGIRSQGAPVTNTGRRK